MSESPYIVELTAENFQSVVLEGSHQVPVLIDFWADWCQPCKMLMPLLARLADEYQGQFILAKVNTEQQQALAMQFGIRSIPTCKLFRNGTEVDEFAGALPEAQVREFLDKHLPRESDGVVNNAELLLQQGDFEAALELLGPAQAADPANPRILRAIAQAHASLGNFEAANFALDALSPEEQQKPEIAILRGQLYFAKIAPQPELVNSLQERLASNENDSEALYQVALAAVMSQDFAAAIDLLLKLMSIDREYADDGAKSALLKLFDMLGEDPLAASGRRRLFNLLH